MNDNRDIIRFAGRLVFDPENNLWNLLTPQVKKEYCHRAQANGWGSLFVCCLKDDLPESFYRKFRTNYQTAFLQRLMESTQLEIFYRMLEAEKIPFIPIKGADLAFRIYPDAALRPHVDWDILFREEDCPAVLRLLQGHGWKTFSGYAPEKELWHYDRMHNDRNSLEIHWSLPQFHHAMPEEIWKETIPLNEFHRVLTPEMNLLLISAHAMSNKYTHSSVQKILMDAGYVLKHDKIDWSKVHVLADRWEILRPDILFSAWSEFFPAGLLPEESQNPETQQLIRETFEMRARVMTRSTYSRQMAMNRHFDLYWLISRFKFYKPSLICTKYHLSAHQNVRIFLYGIWDFIVKGVFFLTHFRSKDSELQYYYQNVEKINRLVKHEK